MAQRPILSSFFALSIAAAAMRIASGPAVPTIHEGSANVPTRQSAGAVKNPKALAKKSWSDRLKSNPLEEGRLSAEEELNRKLCGFAGQPIDVCVAAQPTRPGRSSRNTTSYSPRSVSLPMQPVTGLTVPPSMFKEQPEVILAIVPDPAHTHLALVFDRYIDSFEDALQDSGWEYQGNWLPWRSESGEQQSGEFESREEEKLFQAGREQMPGALLFRPSDRSERPGSPRRPPLIVLLAGDSPTAGIVATQFREALRRSVDLSGKDAPLRILGPSFTGSGPSLKALLSEARTPTELAKTSTRKGQAAQLSATRKRGASLLGTQPIVLVSGSVSDPMCAHFLPEIDGEGRRIGSCGTKEYQGKDNFVSFGADARWALQETQAFLLKRLPANRIAQLTEEESGFGSLFSQPELDSTEPSGAKGKSSVAENVLRLTFPRGIAHLRSAYQKNAIWGFGGSSSASSVSLNLDFDEPRQTDDSVPSFAQRQMPVSQEGSMGQVATILEEHRIKAVVVTATDVLDELFVAQILARRAPNVMVILSGTDVLFLRSGDRGVYRNMYAVSPWPLISRNAVWSKSAKSEPLIRAFPSGDTEGFYTATRYLVGERLDELQDYRSPLRRQSLVGRSSRSSTEDRPSLWFSAIGHGAFWPVALLNDPMPGRLSEIEVPRSDVNLPKISQREGPPSQGGEKAGISQRLLLLIGLVLSVVHSGKCIGWKALRHVAPRYQIFEKATRRPKMWLQLGITGLGLAMLSLTFEPPAPWDWDTEEYFWFALFITGLFFLATAAARLCWRLLDLAGEELRSSLFLAPLLLAFSVGVWAFLWSSLPGSAPDADGMKQFFYFRSRHPLSGASPVLPLLIALNGLTVFLFSQLGRLTFTPCMAPRLPKPVMGVRNCPGQADLSGVDSLLVWPPPKDSKGRAFFRAKFLIFAVVVGSVILVCAFLRLAPQTFEGAPVEWSLRAVLFPVLVGMAWDLTMAVVIWNRLRRECLVPLESSPLRRGFTLISGMSWKFLWMMPQSHEVKFRTLTRALEQATRRVMDGCACAADDGENLREAVDGLWRMISKEDVTSAREKYGVLQDRLSIMAHRLLLFLRDQWAKEVDLVTVTDAFTEGGEATGRTKLVKETVSIAEQIRLLAEEWVALIYIHYIRLVLLQVRNRLWTAAALYLLLVWSITCYSFMNRHVLMIGLLILLGLLAFVITSTYASINKDPILSRTVDEKPGKLDFDFYWKTASMVGLPLLGFVASQFPEVSSFVFSWIEPGMTATK